MGEKLLKAAVILCVVVLVIEAYYIYRFYAALPSNAPETAVAEVTTLQSRPPPGPSAREIEAGYVAGVEEVQTGAVRAFLGSDEKLLRPDSLTAADIEDMERNLGALEDYAGRAEALDPPEKYRDQHGLLVAAVADLYGAAEIAHRLTTDPVSADQSDYDAYDLRVDRAATGLRRSNDLLGEDFATVEGGRGAAGVDR